MRYVYLNRVVVATATVVALVSVLFAAAQSP